MSDAKQYTYFVVHPADQTAYKEIQNERTAMGFYAGATALEERLGAVIIDVARRFPDFTVEEIAQFIANENGYKIQDLTVESQPGNSPPDA
jgi:hypothetical protein